MMMQTGVLPAAAVSPRIVGGVLKWYEGDTFLLRVQLEIKDQNGSPVDIREGQRLEFVFRDHRACEVHRVFFEHVEDNSVTLAFDEEVSALFPAGEYTYDVVYYGFARKTLVHHGPVRVE